MKNAAGYGGIKVTLKLLCFLMKCVLFAESAVLVHLKSVGVILLVLLGFVIALLAFAASKSNLNSHFGTSYFIYPSLAGIASLYLKERFPTAQKKAHKKKPTYIYTIDKMGE